MITYLTAYINIMKICVSDNLNFLKLLNQMTEKLEKHFKDLHKKYLELNDSVAVEFIEILQRNFIKLFNQDFDGHNLIGKEKEVLELFHKQIFSEFKFKDYPKTKSEKLINEIMSLDLDT